MSARAFVITAVVAMPFMGMDRFVPSPQAAADQAMDVLQQARAALGGDAKLNAVKALSLEGPFTREMGQRQLEGTATLIIAPPDRMHRSEETELPGGATLERISALAGETAWDDVQNRGGMGGGNLQIMTQQRGPGGQPMNEEALAQARARRMKAELHRWLFALLAQSGQPPTYAGVAEAAEGKADVLELKDERGQAIRLFVDQQTHLPLMLNFQEMRPRMMFGGGRGPGGPGGRGRRGGGEPDSGPPPDREAIRRQIEAQGPPPPSAVSMYFSDYRAEGGVKIPHKITQSVDNQPSEEWTIEKVKVNPSVKPELFEKKSK